jgi:hypothetical protein
MATRGERDKEEYDLAEREEILPEHAYKWNLCL